MEVLEQYEQKQTWKGGFPALKEIFVDVARSRLGRAEEDPQLMKVVRASEQRVRRAIWKKMEELRNNTPSSSSVIRINMKKFIQALYFEAKRIQQERQSFQ